MIPVSSMWGVLFVFGYNFATFEQDTASMIANTDAKFEEIRKYNRPSDGSFFDPRFDPLIFAKRVFLILENTGLFILVYNI